MQLGQVLLPLPDKSVNMAPDDDTLPLPSISETRQHCGCHGNLSVAASCQEYCGTSLGLWFTSSVWGESSSQTLHTAAGDQSQPQRAQRCLTFGMLLLGWLMLNHGVQGHPWGCWSQFCLQLMWITQDTYQDEKVIGRQPMSAQLGRWYLLCSLFLASGL